MKNSEQKGESVANKGAQRERQTPRPASPLGDLGWFGSIKVVNEPRRDRGNKPQPSPKSQPEPERKEVS